MPENGHYESYDDFYDNGPGSENFKRETMNTLRDSTPFVLKTEVAKMDAELKYLRWFKQNADFGPADGDVHMIMDEQYEKETGNKVPANWRQE